METGIDPRFFLSDDPDEQRLGLAIIELVIDRAEAQEAAQRKQRLRQQLGR